MIEILNKELCCGCEGCVQICPRHSITFEEDGEGFRYPRVDRDRCNECGLCDTICPVLNPKAKLKPLGVYGVVNRDEAVRAESSSGGLFTLLAENVLADGGVVFGAVFDENWGVKHTYTESVEGLAAMRSSKYSQSRIGTIYRDVERFLKGGRKVLFSATPCHVSGLKSFLRRDYEGLLAVDFICHGVPSPKVWRGYLHDVVRREVSDYTIEGLTFRDKRSGWRRYGVHIWGEGIKGGVKEPFSIYTPSYKNVYMRGFLKDLYLRPSCHACPSRSLSSGSDLMIADFWGDKGDLPRFEDDRGLSMVVVNSKKGAEAYSSIGEEKIVAEAVSAKLIQPIVYKSAKRHHNRAKFFKALNDKDNKLSTVELIVKYNVYRWWKKLFKEFVRFKKQHFKGRWIKG